MEKNFLEKKKKNAPQILKYSEKTQFNAILQ